MITRLRTYAVLAACAVAVPAWSGTVKCSPDSVNVGNLCIDRYEASVWQIPPANTKLVKKVQAGKATLADLTNGGATQLAPASSCEPGYPANFPQDGNWTPIAGSNPPSPGVYAVSIPGVRPSACINWFQANQVCLLSGKRLLTNREWQGAAAGTPDPGTDDGSSDCNFGSASDAVNTGSRTSCVSSWGVSDMVGNVWEWVSDWSDRTDGCTSWVDFGNDLSCFGGPGSAFSNLPGALFRGGGWGDGAGAGVLAVLAEFPSFSINSDVGFRCAR